MNTRISSPITWVKIGIFVSILPFLWLFTQSDRLGGIQIAGGNIIGFLGAVLLWWQFVLGIRFISSYITRDYVSVISFHKLLGKYGGGLALLHPVWQMINYSEGISFLYSLNLIGEFEEHVTYGRLAFFALIIVWVTSALLRSKISFRPWMYIHYVTYPMMALVFLHANDIGTFLNAFPLLQVYWFGFAGSFFLMAFYRAVSYINIGKCTYRLIEKKTVGAKNVVYTFEAVGQILTPRVGQFVFLKSSMLFGEAHPFTVMQSAGEGRFLKLGIKSVGLFTKKLSTLSIGSTVYLDGPYGVFTRQGQNSSPKVLIAGGIGITPFIGLIEKYGNQKTYLFYANKDYSDALFRTTLQSSLKERFIEAVSQESPSDATIVKGRFTVDIFKDNLTPAVLSEAEFFVCGSPHFMRGMDTILSALGITKEKIHTEEFGL